MAEAVEIILKITPRTEHRLSWTHHELRELGAQRQPDPVEAALQVTQNPPVIDEAVAGGFVFHTEKAPLNTRPLLSLGVSGSGTRTHTLVPRSRLTKKISSGAELRCHGRSRDGRGRSTGAVARRILRNSNA